MAGPLQVGDIINLGKIAWDIYKFGWSDDLNASKFPMKHTYLARIPPEALSQGSQVRIAINGGGIPCGRPTKHGCLRPPNMPSTFMCQIS